ncbi:MAG TPA: phosphohydrolase [Clostridiales bacterium UBA8153]|nr:phosphohydrolase [Clostridiales bacterium UBA8153]
MPVDLDMLRVQLRAKQSTTTFAHTLGVVAAVELLAARYDIDREQARLAAFLHDVARDMETSELLKRILEYGILIDEIEAKEPLLLHAKVGAAMGRTLFGIEDEAVLQAVERHTTGAPGMTALDAVIYVADYIEPGRDSPGVDEVRRAAGQDLGHALVLAMNGTVQYLLRENRLVHPRTVDARNHLLREGMVVSHQG